jgi:phage gp36-like protein
VAYCTLDHIKMLISMQTLLLLCDDDNVGAIVTTPPNTAFLNVEYAISQADNLIDSYIGGRYTLPLTAVPGLIRDASANLAACNLYGRKLDIETPQGVLERRKMVIKWLDDIKAGSAGVPELESGEAAVYKSSRSAEEKMFPDDVLEQM